MRLGFHFYCITIHTKLNYVVVIVFGSVLLLAIMSIYELFFPRAVQYNLFFSQSNFFCGYTLYVLLRFHSLMMFYIFFTGIKLMWVYVRITVYLILYMTVKLNLQQNGCARMGYRRTWAGFGILNLMFCHFFCFGRQNRLRNKDKVGKDDFATNPTIPIWYQRRFMFRFIIIIKTMVPCRILLLR